MQSSSRRQHIVVLASALTLIAASACSSAATTQRTWYESNGSVYSRCDDGVPAVATTRASVDTSIAPGDVQLSFVNAVTGKPIPAAQVAHTFAQITPDSLAYSDNDGRMRLHYLQRSAVVLAVRTIGWSPDSVTVDTRSGNDVRFALHSLCAR
jgi:hypothetical protein